MFYPRGCRTAEHLEHFLLPRVIVGESTGGDGCHHRMMVAGWRLWPLLAARQSGPRRSDPQPGVGGRLGLPYASLLKAMLPVPLKKVRMRMLGIF